MTNDKREVAALFHHITSKLGDEELEDFKYCIRKNKDPLIQLYIENLIRCIAQKKK